MRAGRLLLCLLASASGLRAQGSLPAAFLSAPFENAVSGARFSAQGDAAYSPDDDASLMLMNPAGLGSATSSQAAFHHNSWFGGVLEETVLLGLPQDFGWLKGSLGIAANYVNYGSFQGRDDSGNPTTALGASDLGLAAGFGSEPYKGLYAGASLKYLQQTLAGQNYISGAADLGMMAALGRGFSASLALMNLGTDMGGSPRASEWRLGLAGRHAWEKESLRVSLGLSQRGQGTGALHAGLEAELGSLFSLRCGTALPFQEPELDGLRYLAFGLGLKFKALRFDYAYLPFGELGVVQRLSLGSSFGSFKGAQPVAAVPELKRIFLPPLPPPSTQPAADPGPLFQPPPAAMPRAQPTPSGQAYEIVMSVSDEDLEEARELLRQGKSAEAISAYSRAIQKSPEDAAAWRELGELYFKLKRMDFALRCFEEVLKFRPEERELRAWVETLRAKSKD